MLVKALTVSGRINKIQETKISLGEGNSMDREGSTIKIFHSLVSMYFLNCVSYVCASSPF